MTKQEINFVQKNNLLKLIKIDSCLCRNEGGEILVY